MLPGNNQCLVIPPDEESSVDTAECLENSALQLMSVKTEDRLRLAQAIEQAA